MPYTPSSFLPLASSLSAPIRHPTIRNLPVRGISDILILYHPSTALFGRESSDLEGNNAVLRIATEAAIQGRAREPNRLWWRIITHTSSKSVVLASARSRLKRQWCAAFGEGLKRRGLDSRGQPKVKDVEGGDGGVEGVKRQGSGRGLSGTLEILIRQGAGMETTMEEKVGVMDKIVDRLAVAGMGGKPLKLGAETRR